MRRVASVVVAASSAFLACLVIDRVVVWTDLDHEIARGRPNQHRMLTTPEFSIEVTTNALGFREPRLPSPKPRGTRRIVAIGDSFVFGYGVEEPDSLPRRLETRLRVTDARVEVLNLGVPGTNPLDYAGALREPGLRYEPDVVLVGVMANDVHETMMVDRHHVAFATALVAQARHDVESPRPWWRRWPAWFLPALHPLVWERLHALGTRTVSAEPPPDAGPQPSPLPPGRWRDVYRGLAARLGEAERADEVLRAETPPAFAPVLTGDVRIDTPEGVDAYRRVIASLEPDLQTDSVVLAPAYDGAWTHVCRTLGSIARTARAAGARPVFAFFPAANQVTPAARAPQEAAGFRWDARTLTDTTFADRLHRCGDDLGVQVIDLLPTLRARAREGAELYYPDDGHWTVMGNEVAANAIAAALLR